MIWIGLRRLSVLVLVALFAFPPAGGFSARSPPVLCVGEALFDCIANDSARGVSVEEMLARGAWTAFPGGAPANVATALCKLGTPSAFAGCVGMDTDGDKIEALLRRTGVDVTLLRRAEDGSPTRRVMVTLTPDGDRMFAGFSDGRPADAFADCQLDIDSLRGDAADAVVGGAKWLVCGTLCLAFSQTGNAVKQLVDRCLESGAKLFVDVNWRPVFWPASAEEEARREILRLAQRAQIVKLTDEEAEWLLGIPAAEALADPKRLQNPAGFPNCIAVLVTAGEKGASYSVSGHTGKIEAFRVDVVETTGAGDAFTAGFLHCLLSMDLDLNKFNDLVPTGDQPALAEQLVRFAAAVGALTCTAEGAIDAQPTFADVESFLIHGQKNWS